MHYLRSKIKFFSLGETPLARSYPLNTLCLVAAPHFLPCLPILRFATRKSIFATCISTLDILEIFASLRSASICLSICNLTDIHQPIMCRHQVASLNATICCSVREIQLLALTSGWLLLISSIISYLWPVVGTLSKYRNAVGPF